MARFFVGQRVRIVRVPKRWEFLLGKETNIVRPSSANKKHSDWEIALIDPESGKPLLVAECNIEPIFHANKPVSIAKIVAEFPGLARALGVVA